MLQIGCIEPENTSNKMCIKLPKNYRVLQPLCRTDIKILRSNPLTVK